MSKNTIFGEEHFIDTQMIKLVEQRNNLIDNYVFEQMENAIKGTLFVEMPKVEIDKEKLKKWVILCSKLENIEHSELVDMATKKRIAELKAKLADSEKDRLMWQEMYKSADRQNKEICETDIYPLQEENQQLKQQLAELEEENDQLQDKLHSYYEEVMNKGTCGFCEYLRTEYKTDFAIEQLEKVKGSVQAFDGIELIGFIDQQIKQLREGR